MADAAGSVQTPIEAIWRKQVASFERNRQEQHREAIKKWQLQQEENPRNPESYIQLAGHHQQLGEYKKALEVVERGLHVCAPSSGLYRFAVMSLAESNRTKEAIQTARIAAALFPGEELFFNLKAKVLLPVLYDTAEEINYYHDRFSTGITELLAELRLDTPHEKRTRPECHQRPQQFLPCPAGPGRFQIAIAIRPIRI